MIDRSAFPSGTTVMKTQIEKIIQADENAFEMVEAAKQEAREVRVRAQRKADEIVARKETELAEASSAEVQQIMSEAREKALQVIDTTDQYLEKIRERKNAVSTELISFLLQKVTGL